MELQTSDNRHASGVGDLSQPQDDRDFVQPAAPTDIVDAIHRYLANIAIRNDRTPAELGALQGYRRRCVINAALVMAIAKAVRHCDRRTALTVAFLFYVAVRSDNANGRCCDSAARIAAFLACGEDVARDVRDALLRCGALRNEERPGQPVAVWLPYVEESFRHSDFAMLEAIAPPRRGPGRPRSAEKTPGVMGPAYFAKPLGVGHPTFSENPRAFRRKTPGVNSENPGSMTPDSKNSLQGLNASTQGGVRSRANHPSATRLCSEGEVSEGVARLEHALIGQSFGGRPNDHRAWRSWREQLDRNQLARDLSQDDAFALAAVARAATNWWPSPAQLGSALDARAREIERRDRQRADYAVRQPRFLEWQRQTKEDQEIRDAVRSEVAPMSRGQVIEERLSAANIKLRQFDHYKFHEASNRPVRPSDEPVVFTWPEIRIETLGRKGAA